MTLRPSGVRPGSSTASKRKPGVIETWVPAARRINEFDYSHTRKEIAKGAEMGRFNMGSTVILLTGKNVEWLPHIAAGQTVKMGQLIGHFPN